LDLIVILLGRRLDKGFLHKAKLAA